MTAPTSRLTALYIAALASVATLTVAGQAIVQSAIDRQEADSRVVNIAGRQRMLSQKLAKAALARLTNEQAGSADELRTTLRLWEKSHRGLRAGDSRLGLPGENSPEVRRMFAELQPTFDGIRTAAARLADVPVGSPSSEVRDAAERILRHEPEFLRRMDAIVFQYDAESQAKTRRLRFIEQTLLVVTLAVLLAEGLFVFRPAVTRLRRAAKRLEKSNTDLASANAMLDAVVENFPGPISLKDAESRYLLINRAQAESLGTNLGVVGDADRDRRVLLAGRAVTFEETRPDSAGRQRHWLTLKAPVAAPGGGRVITVSTEITELKAAQAERAALESRLAEAQKHETVAFLAGGLAHDFNNLLTVILGGVRAMADADADARVRTAAELEEAILGGAGLSRQLLAYAGKGAVVSGPVRLDEAVAHTARLAERGLVSTTEVVVEPPESPVAVWADEAQIRQAVMNLIINAHDALLGQPGTVHVRVGRAKLTRADLDGMLLGPHLAKGDYARLTVQDRGCGMTADTLAKVFDPFFTTKSKGQGMGLAAVLGIVRANGGCVKVDSGPGRGTRFDVYLPALAVAPPPMFPRELPPPAAPAAAVKLLVIDDEMGVRRFAAAVLRGAGYEVIEAADGAEGLRLLAAASDLAAVVTDMTMPEVTGADVLAAARRQRPGLPVVLMTGYAKDGLPAAPNGDPPPPVLAKPFAPAALLEVVASALSSGEHRR